MKLFKKISKRDLHNSVLIIIIIVIIDIYLQPIGRFFDDCIMSVFNHSQTSRTINDDIRYTAFDDMMRQVISEKGNTISVFFLAIGDITKKEDPSFSLLSRFRGRKPKVLPESKMIFKGLGGVKSEVAVYVKDITWVLPNRVHVTYGYYSDYFTAREQTVSMRYVKGRWVVKDVIREACISYNY